MEQMENYDIILSLASNIQQEQNLTEALRRLSQVLFNLRLTKRLWTKPYKKSPSPSSVTEENHKEPLYLNQVLYAQTCFKADELNEILKDIETDMGRTPELRAQGIVPIDLDLMKHDDTRYHLQDWERDYFQQLLQEETLEIIE